MYASLEREKARGRKSKRKMLRTSRDACVMWSVCQIQNKRCPIIKVTAIGCYSPDYMTISVSVVRPWPPSDSYLLTPIREMHAI